MKKSSSVLAILAVQFWAVSATISAKALSFVDYASLSALIHLSVVVFISPLAFAFLARHRHFGINFIAKNLWRILAAGTALLAYDLLFYYALSNGPIIPVIIINSLWPIFVIGWSRVIAIEDWQHLGVRQVLLVFAAFCGAGIATLPPSLHTTFAEWAWAAYIAALGSAIAGGFWEVLLVRIRQEIASSNATSCQPTEAFENTPATNSRRLSRGFFFDLQPVLLAQWAARTATFPIAVAIYILLGDRIHTDLEPALPMVFAIVIIGYVLGDSMMTLSYSIESSPSVGAIVYLTPLATATLMFLLLAVPVSGTNIIGSFIVVCSNWLLAKAGSGENKIDKFGPT